MVLDGIGQSNLGTDVPLVRMVLVDGDLDAALTHPTSTDACRAAGIHDQVRRQRLRAIGGGDLDSGDDVPP